MNKDINALLFYLVHTDKLKQEEKQYIVDYITNLQQGYDNAIKQSLADHKYASQKEDEFIELQQENEKLKEELEEETLNKEIAQGHRKQVQDIELQERHELADYKSRCEKASDKLSFIDEALENDTLNVSLCITKINSSLNILQNGGEKDE